MTIDLTTFKAGMRHLAGGVCVITTVGPRGQRAGLTATAVCSVSAAPPTLLVCVNRGTRSHAAIRAAGFFAVNVLGLHDQELAHRFAGTLPGEQRFAGAAWMQLTTGAPVLESALVSFDCRIAEAVEVGTHGIIFGAIQALHFGPHEPRPLLYAHGSYGGFAAALATPGPEEEEL